jgi:hypothetical protein
MVHDFQPGDFLIFQLEAGYGLLRVLAVEHVGDDDVWHVSAYRDLFPDPELADAAIQNPGELSVEVPHVALTNRAFESTQVAKMGSASLSEDDLTSYRAWRESDEKKVSDRSIRLILGWR